MNRKLIGLIILAFLSSLPRVQAEETTQTHRVFQFENEYVKVWKTVIMPHQPLSLHRHDHSRVVVGLKGGALKKIEESGERSNLSFETGKAYWLTEDPPGLLHGDVNESDEPIEVMIIELCQGKIQLESKAEVIAMIHALKEQGAQAILLGCTELGMLIGQQDSPIPVYDTTALHAQEAVRQSLNID